MMKTKHFLSLTAGILFGALTLNAQTARLQVIHNSADAAAEYVDVWLNNTLLINNFEFRNAWGFEDAPAGVPFDITICDSSSVDTTNEVIRFSGLQLTAGEKYVAVANGIVSASGYSPAPAFNLDIYALGREAASNPANTDILVVHGSTDAPTVDIVAPGVGTPYTNVTLLNNVSYPQFSNYIELPTANYNLQVRTASGSDVVAEYAAPLQTLNLNGAALVAVASGFLNPAVNSNGPAFGIWVAPPTTGPMLQLPQVAVTTARAQIIHNCADAAAATVDIWLNDSLYANNISFRQASSWIDVPAGVPFDITICGSTSTDTTAEVVRFSYDSLPGGSKNTIIASGIVVAANYNPAPAFSLEIFGQGREVANNPSNTDVLVYHGSTDAPTVDVVAPLVATLVNDISYSEYDGYLELPTANYNLQVRTSSGTDVVAEYSAPLQALNLGGQSITVLASGFLDSTVNNNGPAFGLWVALPGGGNLVQLPLVATSTTRAQLIHNCADAAAALVDIWLNNDKVLDSFAFRSVTEFGDLPAGVPFDITVCAAGSTDTTSEVARVTYNLSASNKYILVASGIVSATGYSPNPNFSIEVFANAREEAANAANTDILVFHGSTDAPTVDVEEAFAGTTLVNDASYTNFAGYLPLPTANYNISVTDATGNTVVASYLAPLQALGLQGQAITVVASGFLTPANNSGGPAFGLYVALASGSDTLIPLPLTTGISETDAVANMVMFPNPAQNNVQIAYSLESPVQQGMITLTDMSGRTVQNLDLGSLSVGNYMQDVQLAGLEKGIYIVELMMDGKVSRQRLVIGE